MEAAIGRIGKHLATYRYVRPPDLCGFFSGVDEIRMSQKNVAEAASGW
jgi:hypothetical protein